MPKTVSIAGVRVAADKFYGEIVPTVKRAFHLNLEGKVETALLELDIEKRKAILSRAEQLRTQKELIEGALMLEKMDERLIKFSAAPWRCWCKFF